MDQMFRYSEQGTNIVAYQKNCSEKNKNITKSFVEFLKTLSEKGIISMKEIKNAINEAQDESTDEIFHKIDNYTTILAKRLK